MALLGKLLKGKTTKASTGDKTRNIKYRTINKTQEDYDNEKKLSKIKRDNLRNMIGEEQKLVAFNRKKLLANWRNIMRIAKTEELRNEIEVYSQNNARELDSKEAYLQMLDKNLDEADEQYQMALRNHLIHLDELIALQDSRLTAMQNEFDRDTRIIVDEFEREKEEIRSIFGRQIRELEDMADTINEDEKQKNDIAKNEFQTFREETRNKNSEEMENIKMALDAKQKRLNTDLEALHQKYTNDTQSMNTSHTKLFEENQLHTKDIDNHVKDIDRLKIKIEHMKLKIHQHTKESKKRNDALRKEKDNINKNYQELKAKMMKFRDNEQKRLTELVVNSRNAVLTLKDQLTLGERILKTAELCRRLETEREKVLPFYESTVEDGEVPEDLLGEFEEVKPEQYAEYSYLNNFFKRYNKVQLDEIAIEKQKEQLEKENQILKTMLKQYLDGISLNDEVLRNPNPLLVVNDKIDVKKLPIEKLAPPQTFVEGVKVVNHYIRQGNN